MHVIGIHVVAGAREKYPERAEALHGFMLSGMHVGIRLTIFAVLTSMFVFRVICAVFK